MRYEGRVPQELIKEGHYLGRPADAEDKIIQRRVGLVKACANFCHPELKLLEIGCGNGASMFLLQDEFKELLGLEMEPIHLEEFEQLKDKFQAANCHARQHDIEKEELPGQWDRIISFEVIEHLTDENAVQFYYDKLKPGGLMAISVPNKWWIFETHGAQLPLLPWNRVPFFSWLPRPLHERWANARIYTKKRIHKLLEKHGFTVEQSQYITAPLDVLSEGALKNWLTKNIFSGETTKTPFLSTSLFIIAKKPE